MQATTPPIAPPARRRIPALDAARAVGVLAMVFGHTLDALLAPAVRTEPAVALYWKARGLTAPLFLLVSGWAVTVAIQRGRAHGFDVLRGRIGRVGLLLLIGFGLRWPGWDLPALFAGKLDVWRHFLSFDALHAIAVALFGSAVLMSLTERRRVQAIAFVALIGGAIVAGLHAPFAPSTTIPGLFMEQALGGTSPFPIVPWIAYFYAGALVGVLAGDAAGRRAAAMAAVGLPLAALVFLDVGEMPPAHPVLIGFRIGTVILLLALLSVVPAGASKLLAPVGRTSLAVYAIHVPIVYGWSTYPGLAGWVGPRLSFAAAAGVALLVLLASFVLARAWGAARRGLAWAWDRRGAAADAVVGYVWGPRDAKD